VKCNKNFDQFGLICCVPPVSINIAMTHRLKGQQGPKRTSLVQRMMALQQETCARKPHRLMIFVYQRWIL